MAARSDSLIRTRGRMMRMLRFLLRRKQCTIITVIETLTTFILIGANVAFVSLQAKAIEEHADVLSLIKDIEEGKKGFNLWHCKYGRLPLQLDQFNVVNCHDNIITFADVGIERLRPRSCAGFDGTPMPQTLFSSNAKIFVRFICIV
uniref:Col_cuticle_N domain-containing protein n=1 Tax=Ascaris lumbricoides TaxID=6252 RepID=A0A0M3ITK3_ASCLU